jgi:glycosyltransferase involved in cell wall biosynthesis
MNILHINSYYITGRFYKNLFQKQLNKNLELDVFVPVPTKNKYSLSSNETNTLISPNHAKYDRYNFFLKHKKIYCDLIKNYQIGKFKLIHAHSLFSNGYVALKIKQNYGIPYIVAVRNTDVNFFFRYMLHLRTLGFKIMSEADRIVFISEPYKQYVLDRFVPKKKLDDILNKIDIIPNGIDDFWFKNKISILPHKKFKHIKLLFVGTINKNKNILTTIKAIECLKKKGLDIIFTIVGSIEDQNIFKKIMKNTYIIYLEPMGQEKLLDIYRENDIFVMPSKRETFGLVYAEAMSQGLPVIYTRGQGFDLRFEEGEVGYSVFHNSHIEISKKIEMIIENYQRISERCVNNIEKFDWEIISDKYVELYKKIVKGD